MLSNRRLSILLGFPKKGGMVEGREGVEIIALPLFVQGIGENWRRRNPIFVRSP
jgi:hypothetical protein